MRRSQLSTHDAEQWVSHTKAESHFVDDRDEHLWTDSHFCKI